MKSNSLQKGFAWIITLVLIGITLLGGAAVTSYKTQVTSLQNEINQLKKTQNSRPAIVGSALPASVPSVFETYLSAQQGTSDTTLTLASGSLRDGSTLTGYQCFTVDSNTPSLEYECGTANGTSITGITRGIDAVSGTSTVAALTFNHILGADVKITDYPSLTYLIRMANGSDTYDQPIRYNASVSTSTQAANRNNMASAGLVADTAFSGAGVINATTNAKGTVQIATPLQIASSTGTCSSGASCAITADNATSTFQSATAGLKIIVTQNNGKIDNNFISTTGFLPGLTTTAATTTFASSTLYLANEPAYSIGKHVQVFSSTGTSTFSVPNGITRVLVQLLGGGGGGGGSNSSTNLGAGGGAGGYAEKIVDVTGTSSITVFVGSGGSGASGSNNGVNGTWSTFGVNGSFFNAPGGGGSISGTGQPGGNGGIPTTGDVNITGGSGCANISATGIATGGGVCGGSSYFGSFNSYGSGGQGAAPSGGGSAGLQGVIIVRW